MKNVTKYQRQYYMPPMKCMKWAEKEYVDKAPIWCSVDLRDGNQALVIPMSEYCHNRKTAYRYCDKKRKTCIFGKFNARNAYKE